MHEARVVREVVEKIQDIAAAEGATSIDRVSISLGALSHVTPESFIGHFELLTDDTIAADARLEIERLTDLNDPAAQDIRLVSVVVSD